MPPKPSPLESNCLFWLWTSCSDLPCAGSLDPRLKPGQASLHLLSDVCFSLYSFCSCQSSVFTVFTGPSDADSNWRSDELLQYCRLCVRKPARDPGCLVIFHFILIYNSNLCWKSWANKLRRSSLITVTRINPTLTRKNGFIYWKRAYKELKVQEIHCMRQK